MKKWEDNTCTGYPESKWLKYNDIGNELVHLGIIDANSGYYSYDKKGLRTSASLILKFVYSMEHIL